MIQSANVCLRRATEEPMRRVKERYGSADGMESALEHYVLAAECRARRGQCLECMGEASGLVALLADIAAYGSLGIMGHAEQRVCNLLTPLLIRLTKATLRDGFALAAALAEGGEQSILRVDKDAILELTARAISNCSGGVCCRAADCVFEVHDTSDTAIAPLSVRFGFADYASSETGAMLWAGAVGLALFLVEHSKCWMRSNKTGELVIVEIGCGPGLVSLIVAALLARDWKAITTNPAGAGAPADLPHRVRLDVTDIADGAVEEVRRSFVTHNHFNGKGITCRVISSNSDDGDSSDRCHAHSSNRKEEEEEDAGVALGGEAVSPAAKATVRGSCTLDVNPRALDFSNIQDPSMIGAYDLLLASDVVYDFAIAQHVAPAIEVLLRPGGTAILCCEAHRDGMCLFTQRIREHAAVTQLEVVTEEVDVRRLLNVLQMPDGLTTSTCSIIVIRKKGGG